MSCTFSSPAVLKKKKIERNEPLVDWSTGKDKSLVWKR